MNLRSFSFAAAVAAAALPAQAVTVAQWDFEASPLSGTVTATGSTYSIASSVGTGIATGLHSAATTVFSSPVGNGSSKSFSSNTWAAGDYWQFSFSTTGYSGLTVSWDQFSSSTGPTSFSLAYSTDGTSYTTLTSYTVSNTGSWSGTGAPKTGYSFSYDVAALSNASTAYVRLVNSTVGAGGTDRVDNFTVATTAVPEASTSAMLAAGLAAMGFLARRRRSA